MLVLSRKAGQEVMIGDDIKLTVVRVDGNRVRIGISAPRDVRILRGELAVTDATGQEVEFELSEREFAFAHQNATDRISEAKSKSAAPRLSGAEPQMFFGAVSLDGSKVQLQGPQVPKAKSAPLASFVSAS